MKKLFVIALAAVGMVACVNDEIVETPQGNAISFDNAFIDNATRAELTAVNLDKFNVWGYIDAGSGQVAPLFEGDEVSKATGDWTYGGGARYWAPGMQHYFQAIAPLTAVEAVHADGEVTAINYTVDGDSDLIYAAYDKVGAAAGSTNGPVSFTFGHLLSKVEFEFVNGFAAEDGVSIAVKNVKMTVPAKGTYDIETGEWAVDATASKTLENIDEAQFVLPYDNSYAYAIEFDVDVTYGTVVINKDVHKTSSVMVALNKGTAYKFTATINAETLNMESIDFEVGEVGDWTPGGNSTLGTAYVSTADALWAALGNSGVDTIVLTDDINLNEATTRSVTDPVMTIAAGKTVTIDLNEKTLSSTSSSTGKNYNMFDVRGNLTVKNGTMEYEHKGDNMEWNNFAEIFYVGFNGTLNLDGVTAKNLGGSNMAYVIDMVNATNITVNVKNSTLESTYIPIRVFNNNTTGVHNVTIKNTTLKGKYCFWVQFWLADGRDEATLQNTLKLDIFNKAGEINNTFTCTNDKNVPILYGDNEYVYIDQYGEEISFLTPIEGVEGVALDTEGNYVITADEGLASISALIAADEDGFAGKTILLDADVDLAGVAFAPIGYNPADGSAKQFKGTFDGQGNTIKNLNQQDLNGGYTQSVGLFSSVADATIKNLVIEDIVAAKYGAEAGAIASIATGDCTFEKIEVKSGSIVAYNNDASAIVGWANVGNFTFKDITIGSDVTVHSLWNSYDTSVGGVIGTLNSGSTATFENIIISCKLDVYNDVCANYQWGAYRRAGMLIGNMSETQTIDGSTRPDPSAAGVTCNNVTVIYGDWMNYHYCEFKSNGHGSYDDEFTWKCTRVEGSDWGSNTIDTTQCNHESFESHNMCMPVDQLFGGGQGVYGLAEYDGVTVHYPASYTPEN